ncbi:MAG: 2-oxo acid dehydrogenase subunit E2 [Chloroflexi bacterium]|nr:2-oxo acid dehydrogenase subunit E2 [Chloroflexota bacterium]
MPTKVIMPQLGESVVEGTVSRWLKREGDTIQEYEPLLEVSTDKVDTEVPAPASGVLLKIYVPEGQTVERGVLLAEIGQADETPDGEGEPAGTRHVVSLQSESTQSQPAATNGGSYTGHVTPVVARMVAEHHLDLSQIKGTGRDGRVTKKDVEAYLAAQENANVGVRHAVPLQPSPEAETELPPWERPGSGDLFKPTVEYGETPPSSAFPVHGEGEKRPAVQPPQPAQRVHPVEPIPQGAPGELVPLSAIRRAIAEHMVRSKLHTSPHVTTVFEVDMSAVMAHRQANKDAFARQGVNLTFTAYFAAAAVKALQANPYLNAQWTDEGIYLHHAVHLGIAVAIADGLIVPVIKNAQELNLLGLARAVNDLSTRARNKQLKPDEVQGGTFTITNHGVSGSLLATPIINQPQVGILGVGIVEKRVKVINDAIAIRPCCYVTLTFDHRVADGAVGDAFMQTLKQTLEGWT